MKVGKAVFAFTCCDMMRRQLLHCWMACYTAGSTSAAALGG